MQTDQNIVSALENYLFILRFEYMKNKRRNKKPGNKNKSSSENAKTTEVSGSEIFTPELGAELKPVCLDKEFSDVDLTFIKNSLEAELQRIEDSTVEELTEINTSTPTEASSREIEKDCTSSSSVALCEAADVIKSRLVNDEVRQVEKIDSRQTKAMSDENIAWKKESPPTTNAMEYEEVDNKLTLHDGSSETSRASDEDKQSFSTQSFFSANMTEPASPSQNVVKERSDNVIDNPRNVRSDDFTQNYSLADEAKSFDKPSSSPNFDYRNGKLETENSFSFTTASDDLTKYLVKPGIVADKIKIFNSFNSLNSDNSNYDTTQFKNLALKEENIKFPLEHEVCELEASSETKTKEPESKISYIIRDTYYSVDGSAGVEIQHKLVENELDVDDITAIDECCSFAAEVGGLSEITEIERDSLRAKDLGKYNIIDLSQDGDIKPISFLQRTYTEEKKITDRDFEKCKNEDDSFVFEEAPSIFQGEKNNNIIYKKPDMKRKPKRSFIARFFRNACCCSEIE